MKEYDLITSQDIQCAIHYLNSTEYCGCPEHYFCANGLELRNGQDALDFLDHIVFERGCYLDDLKKKYDSDYMNNYKAFKIFGADVVKDMCKEKIDNKEDLGHFLNLRNTFVFPTKEENKVSGLEVEQARNVPMELILDQFGIEHTRSRCRCVLHDGEKPTSFSFKNNLYKCFACGASGDSIQFVRQYMGLGFVDTVNFLIKI